MPVNRADSFKGVEGSASARELFMVKSFFVKRGQLVLLLLRQVRVNAGGRLQHDVGVPKVGVKVNGIFVHGIVVDKRAVVGRRVAALQFRLKDFNLFGVGLGHKILLYKARKLL